MSAPRPLSAELGTPLTPLEVAIGGAPRPRTYPSPQNAVDVRVAMATWGLLAYVLGEAFVPRPAVVVRWKATDRALARQWGERELARKVLGTEGCPSRAAPRCLERYVAAWEEAS